MARRSTSDAAGASGRSDPTTIIRPAGADDIDRAHALIDAAFGAAPSSSMALSRPEVEALIRRQTVSLLEVGGRLIGVIALEPLSDHLFVPVIAIDPTLRGQGYGRRLIEFAAGEAWRRHQRVLRLFADPGDAAGCAFYRQVGFQPDPAAPERVPGRTIGLIRHLGRAPPTIRG